MDLNNLIVTIATSTEALIAIVGGLLISKVSLPTSEQSSMSRRMRESINGYRA